MSSRIVFFLSLTTEDSEVISQAGLEGPLSFTSCLGQERQLFGQHELKALLDMQDLQRLALNCCVIVNIHRYLCIVSSMCIRYLAFVWFLQVFTVVHIHYFIVTHPYNYPVK